MAAILKIVKSPYLTEILSDFDAVWYTAANVEPDYSHVTKNWNFKIQDGGGRHLENFFFGNNSSVWFNNNNNNRISIPPSVVTSEQFCTKKQNCMPTKPRNRNYKFLKAKMVDCRHFENI